MTKLPSFPENLIMAGWTVGQIAVPDEAHMPGQAGIRVLVGDAEDLAQAADAVGLEHFDVHTFGDAVFDPVFADFEPVIGEASVLNPFVMILDIPFFAMLKLFGSRSRTRMIRRKKFLRRTNPWLTVSMISASVRPSAFSSRHMAITA